MPPAADRLVLGTWGLAGSFRRSGRECGYGQVPESVAREVLEAAWQAGIRRLDVAWGYGDGRAAERVGDFQRATGCHFTVTCKAGRVDRDGAIASTTSIGELREEVARLASLVGEPAQVLLKDPAAEVLGGERLGELCAALASEWPSARAGFASHELDTLAHAPAAGGDWVAQIEYHGLALARSRRAAGHLRAGGWAVTGMQPLAYGYAAGKFGASHEFAADDWRRLIPRAQHELQARAGAAFASKLRAAVPGEPVAALALALCLADPALESVVVGPKSPSQLREMLRACALARDARVSALADTMWAGAAAA